MAHDAPQAPRALDPVCGMTVDPAKAAASFAYNGQTYYFCSKGCLAKFSADPEKYLAGHREPMHHHAPPQVISLGGLKKPRAAQAPEAPPDTSGDPGA